MPWAQGFTLGLCGTVLGRQCFTGALHAGLGSEGLGIHALSHGWFSPGDDGG